MIHRLPRRRYTAVAAWLCFVLILATLMGVWWRADAGAAGAQTTQAAPSAIQVYGGAVAHQGEPGAWTCDGGGSSPWVFGNRFGDGSANLAAITLDTQTHDGYLVKLDSFIGQRYFKLFLYSPRYGDLFIVMPYDRVAWETSERPPTGRLDGRGDPSIAYGGGLLRVFFTTWGGDGGAADQGWRGYVFCHVAP